MCVMVEATDGKNKCHKQHIQQQSMQTQHNKNNFNDAQLWLTRFLRVLFATWAATRFQETINAKKIKHRQMDANGVGS